jgi:NitT/TauT family transport system substrate-binding protein
MSKGTRLADLNFDLISAERKPVLSNVEKRRAGRLSRRKFLSTAALATAGAALGLRTNGTAAESPPETTKLRLGHVPSICFAPQYIAEELLRSEGFTDVRDYAFASGDAGAKALASGQTDLGMFAAGLAISRWDAGDPVVILAGVHIGCYELFGSKRVRAIRDLKGKSVAVVGLGSGQHVLLSSMLSYVGLDPRREINWIVCPPTEGMQLLAEEKVDGYMAFPPEQQELRAKKVGHVVVNTMMDKPWSQHFCCMMAGNREFVRSNPVATKQVLSAILRAADICAREPKRAAQFLVDKGYTKNFDYALEATKDIPYNKWREFDPEDTVRFYSLRLQEVGMIKSSPQKIISQGTDWRFLREIKKELKA